jgi:hypothetical protein
MIYKLNIFIHLCNLQALGDKRELKENDTDDAVIETFLI